MSVHSTEGRVRAAATTMEGVCRRMGLIDSDIGKAILRIKVFGYSAKFTGLKIRLRPEATANEDLLVAALRAFKKARTAVRNPDGDGDTYENSSVQEMERAVQSLQ